MRFAFIFLLCGIGFGVLPAGAAEQPDNGEAISVYAIACEPLRVNEARSGARVRAADKASFKAIENITELSDVRTDLPAHDFNVLVYHLADNYLEDMAVRTLEQNDERVCVEVTGYLSPQNIALALQKLTEDKQKSAEEMSDASEDDFLVLENDVDSLPESVTEMPPKPQPKIHQDIAFDAQSETAARAESHKIVVFVNKTKFYNGSETGVFFKDIRQALAENPDIKASTSKEGADYVLSTNVLRAKVDPINQHTYRLQMVVQLELTNTATGRKITEHQNRFILFESDDDEQQVASSLMRKLLNKGCQRLLPKITYQADTSAKNMAGNAIITPAQSPAGVD